MTTALTFLFSEYGRLGRLGYALGIGGITVLFLVALEASAFIPHETAQGVVVLVVMGACLLAYRSLTERRCHDFGKTFWSSLWRDQIPVIGSVWGLAEVFFKPGNAEANEYGGVPRI